MLLERLRWPFAWLGALTVGGTVGYRVIEGWSWFDGLWMVVITLSTIGYGEVKELSALGRIFTMGLVLLGLGAVTYTFGMVATYLLDGEYLTDLDSRRRRKIMNELDQHVIVVGYGRLGREVTAELLHHGRPVVVIESDHDEQERVSQHHHGLEPTLLLEGDGSDEEMLRAAAIQRAEAMAVATGSDATNILVTLTARQENPRLHIVTRVDEMRSIDKAYRAGADNVVNPYGISGVRMARGVLHPHASKLLEHASGKEGPEFQIVDVRLGHAPEVNGPLGSLDIRGRFGVSILALRCGGEGGELDTDLGPATALSAGDVAVVVGRPVNVQAFARVALGSIPDPNR